MELRRPLITPTLIALNLAVFVAMLLSGASVMLPSAEVLLAFGANSGTKVVFEGEWWRPFTSLFVHVGVIHLVVNMYSLWRLGTLIEHLAGRSVFAVVYVVCGVSGSFASVLWNPGHLSAGASGAIFGLFGYLVGFAIRARHLLPPHAARAMWDGIVMNLVLNLVFAMTIPFLDNAAHLGGMAAGVFAGLMATSSAIEREGRGASLLSLGIVGAAVLGLAVLAKVRTENNKEAHIAKDLTAAQEAFESKNYEEAQALTDRVIERTRAPEAYLMRAEIRQFRGDIDGGLADFDQVVASALDSRRVDMVVLRLVQRARLLQLASRYGDAQRDLERAYELNPGPDLAGERGYNRFRLGDLDGGMNDARAALNGAQNNAAVLNNLAWGALNAGASLDLALSLADAAIAEEESPAARGTRCWIRAARGERDFALPDCEAAVAGADQPLDRGMLAFLKGNLRLAVDEWSRASSPDDRNDVAPWLNRAREQLDAGGGDLAPGVTSP
jgi:rhomboid protease GluP